MNLTKPWRLANRKATGVRAPSRLCYRFCRGATARQRRRQTVRGSMAPEQVTTMAEERPKPAGRGPVQPGATGRGPAVLARAWAPRRAGELRLFDCVADPGGGGWRAFLGAGATEADILREAGPGAARIEEVRPLGGGLMLAGSGPARIATAEGIIEAEPSAPEWPLLAGRNVALGFRLAETAAQVAAWLAWHAAEHGLDGALIVDRAAPAEGAEGGADFAARLAAALAAMPGGDLVAVVLAPRSPLGRPGEPAETHPLQAPDAPGKDRMDRPEPDPWLAPLGEAAVHEALKWRFLGAARAVLTLDPCDVLPPRPQGAPSAFDLCAAAAQGVVLMVGRRVYPWRVRAGAEAAIGDHICRQFDARRGIARWGVAPARAGLGRSWRPTRVAFARPDPGITVPFWRCMAIRVPGRATSELAPRTSLIEDPALLALADRLGHRPVRAPVSAPRTALPDPHRTAIVTTMKNEGPFILEWLAFHRAIGVADFLIYTNDCSDGTDRFLELLQHKGLVQHRDNPFRTTGLKPQHAALQAAEDEAVIRNAGWAICMDVDEFINVKLGDGRLPALYAAMAAAHPGANMIALTWRLFGNADVAGFDPERPLIAQFTLCAPELVRKPHQAWGFKTLFRNIDLYKKLGVHRPKGLRPDLWDRIVWLNGSGRPMPRAMFRNGWRSTAETYGYDWVQLNHYACRSAESFLVKRDRGRANHVDRDQGLAYWFRMNHNAVEDRSILRLLPAMLAERDRLMADPDIAAAHAACVEAHRARIAELAARPEQAAFLAELTGPRMRMLSRRLHHFGAAVFSAGPQAIPDAIALAPDLPADFFFTVAHDGEAAH
jgi:hypothetical protein